MMDQDTHFAGKRVGCFETGKPLPDPATTAVTLCVGYGCCAAGHEEKPFERVFEAFIKTPDSRNVDTLVIGVWSDDPGDSSSKAVQALVAHKDRLPDLKALFIGNISQEESEISWIVQSDVSPLLAAFPKLETLRIRGGDGLSLGNCRHPALRTLIIETGGLGKGVVRQLMDGDLPALKHLELWLGADEYGNDCEPADFAPLLGNCKFQGLEYLGLRNADNVDAFAAVLAQSPVIQHLKILDLSLGNLSDAGGAALARSDRLAGLTRLDLHHHYLSNTMVKSLRALPIQVNLEQQLQAEDDDDEPYRGIFVSE